jgi:hypothetical protein
MTALPSYPLTFCKPLTRENPMPHTSTPPIAGGTGCRIGRVRPAPALLAAAVLTLSACASLPAAQVALPAPLAAQTPELVEGIGIGRSGRFTVGGSSGTFNRGRDRLELFEIVNWDSAKTRYQLTLADGARTEAACKGKAVEVTWRVLAANAKPFSVDCEWRGARSAQLAVEAPGLAVGTKAERKGRFTMNSVSIEVQSLHDVQGSPLPLEAPIGYLFTQGGRPVGAIELNGPTPRLWRPAPGDALHEPVTLAALALALLWDPANRTP